MFRGFHFAFPVIDQANLKGDRCRMYQPLLFKQLNNLKTACAQNGPTAPFIESMLESLTMEAPQSWELKTIPNGMIFRRRLFIMQIRVY